MAAYKNNPRRLIAEQVIGKRAILSALSYNKEEQENIKKQSESDIQLGSIYETGEAINIENERIELIRGSRFNLPTTGANGGGLGTA